MSSLNAQIAQKEKPKELQDVGLTEHLGDQIPLDLEVYTADSTRTTLGALLDEGKPVILNPVYYECPMLCSLVMNGMLASLQTIEWNLGEDYNVITISIDHRETSTLAKANKVNYLKQYNRTEASEGWYFLTTDSLGVQKLTQSVGFEFKYIPEQDQFAHSAAIIFLSPDGVITRYLYGVQFKDFDVMNALYEAADGKIGTTTDRVLMYCFSYDPKSNSYVPLAINIMKIGGAIVLLLLGSLLAFLWIKNR